jgi:EAL domain-containing protein (putative c-di-GMP-specific phosphodiesterase class I)
MIGRLTDGGVRLSIDDFLTGYSNFHYLRRFRPAHLKIDQSFIGSMSAGSENLAIVRAAIQMADALGIDTIAEGVETEEQAQLLRDAGCPIAQGYLFGRPLTTVDVTALLRREHRSSTFEGGGS